ncbi:hypothetical protein MHBO_000517 [Bonamia ostreae]|uniref:Uncharacterized protein n=1 Tax=Bonamia ostreae TaxID=126728 RepID=A0ABV2AGG7_9EUKA
MDNSEHYHYLLANDMIIYIVKIVNYSLLMMFNLVLLFIQIRIICRIKRSRKGIELVPSNVESLRFNSNFVSNIANPNGNKRGFKSVLERAKPAIVLTKIQQHILDNTSLPETYQSEICKKLFGKVIDGKHYFYTDFVPFKGKLPAFKNLKHFVNKLKKNCAELKNSNLKTILREGFDYYTFVTVLVNFELGYLFKKIEDVIATCIFFDAKETIILDADFMDSLMDRLVNSFQTETSLVENGKRVLMLQPKINEFLSKMAEFRDQPDSRSDVYDLAVGIMDELYSEAEKNGFLEERMN